MTDLASDADLLSKNELTPQAVEVPGPSSNSLILECPECGATKNKVGVPFITKGQVGTHRANVHGYRAPAAPKKSATPAKSSTAPKKSATPAKSSTSPSPSPARGTRSRKPLGEMISLVVLKAGRLVAQIEPPTGAVLMFEAGALGQAIDDAIAGTFIDKPLQSVAGSAGKLEPLVPLLTLPAMIFMASRDPKMGAVMEGEIREAIEDVLVQSLPLLRKRAQRTKATVEALGELHELDPAVYGAEDPIGVILDSFFEGPPAEAPADGAG